MFRSKAQEPSKLQARVAKIATADLTAWAEQALFGIGRALSSWDKSRDSVDLDEAVQGAEALLAVVSELRNRTSG